MAVKHMKFRYDRTNLVVDDLGSLNGIYLRITGPVELLDGLRFRVGIQTIEFHEAERFESVPPLVSDDGEEYCSGDPAPLAFLDLIRPDGRRGLRFPITRSGATVIGRDESHGVDRAAQRRCRLQQARPDPPRGGTIPARRFTEPQWNICSYSRLPR